MRLLLPRTLALAVLLALVGMAEARGGIIPPDAGMNLRAGFGDDFGDGEVIAAPEYVWSEFATDDEDGEGRHPVPPAPDEFSLPAGFGLAGGASPGSPVTPTGQATGFAYSLPEASVVGCESVAYLGRTASCRAPNPFSDRMFRPPESGRDRI